MVTPAHLDEVGCCFDSQQTRKTKRKRYMGRPSVGALQAPVCNIHSNGCLKRQIGSCSVKRCYGRTKYCGRLLTKTREHVIGDSSPCWACPYIIYINRALDFEVKMTSNDTRYCRKLQSGHQRARKTQSSTRDETTLLLLLHCQSMSNVVSCGRGYPCAKI